MMPDWIQAIVRVNPVSYLTDALRQLIILPLDFSSLIFDLTYLSVFAIVFSFIGIALSWRFLTK